MSIEYNGVNIFDDGDAPSDVVIERGSDGSGVFFHVCCGCHKTHAVTVRSGLLAFTMRYEMPDLADAEKIAASVSAVKEKDLLVFERANDDARAEIAALKAKLAAVPVVDYEKGAKECADGIVATRAIIDAPIVGKVDVGDVRMVAAYHLWAVVSLRWESHPYEPGDVDAAARRLLAAVGEREE